jgi:AcrR family transcriptional regulator
LQAQVTALSRRDRLRAATTQEIVQTARRLLIEQGSAAMSLRAIAREMGMTAPALYRYFSSLEELVHHVVAATFTELTGEIEAAISAAAADAGAPAAPAQSVRSTAISLTTACRAFRGWAVAHPAEFGLLFGTPLPGVDLHHPDPLADCGLSFGGVFLGLITDLWKIKAFEIPADDAIDPVLRPQLARYRELLGTDLPIGVLQTFLRSWVLLYGTVSLEVFGHLKFALEDSAPMFELMLTDLASMVGLTYPLPAES